jgi:hypothetical protein
MTVLRLVWPSSGSPPAGAASSVRVASLTPAAACCRTLE